VKNSEAGKSSDPKSQAPPQPRNPYTAGKPISDPESFFGRDEIFRDVMNMLRSPNENAVVLHGQRRIGKTSVLKQLERRLAEKGEYTPIFFDLMNKASKPLGEVLYELAQTIAVATGLPEPKHDKFDAEGSYFCKAFLPVAAKASAPGGLVLLFDEFDVLDIRRETTANQAGQAFFPYLQTWMSDIQQVKFYFVIGRRPEELSQEARHAFRGARYSHINLLKRKDAEGVIRQSERDGSLNWTDVAVEKVWEWTQGHSFMTQLLCSVVWENAYPYDSVLATVPDVKPADIDAAIADTLRRGENAFDWIWEGLPPAEKVVLAAIAEAKEVVITSERLTEILKQSGIRLIIREFENAPEKLSEWGLLEPMDNGYRVVVPLLRRWVADNRPLRKAQDEVYKIDKIADRQFQLAQDEYKLNNLPEAERLLRNAMARNDAHLNAMLLLGDILTELDRTEETIEILQKVYERDPKKARADLIKALLKMVDKRSDDETEQLTIYERVLNIDPEQAIAQDGRRGIWKRRGETALGEKRWDDARNAFKEAADEDGEKKTELQKHRHEYDTHRQKAEQHAKEKDWASAVRTWEILVQDYNDVADCQVQLLEAKKQVSFEKSYNEALEALERGNLKIATNLLAWVIGQQADYKEAPRHLLRVLYGLEVDVTNFKPYRLAQQKRAVELEPERLAIKEPTPEAGEIDKSKESITDQTTELPVKVGPSRISSILLSLQKQWGNLLTWASGLLHIGEARKDLLIACGVSSVIWLPLFVSSLVLYKNNSDNKLIVNLGLALFVISAVALVLTVWLAYRYRLWERAKAFLMITGERMKVPRQGVIPLSILVIALGMYALPQGTATFLTRSNEPPVIPDSSGPSSQTSQPPTPEKKEEKKVEAQPNLSIPQLADSLMALLPAGKGDKIAKVSNLLSDSLAHVASAQRTLGQKLQDSFYSNAMDFLSPNHKPASDGLAIFLGRLRNQKVLSTFCKKYPSVKDEKAKDYFMEIVKGLAQSRDKKITDDLKMWLGVQQHWETEPEIANEMKATYSKLANPPNAQKTGELINLLPTRLLVTDPKQAVKDMLTLADAPSLYSYVKDKDGQYNDAFYKKALNFLQTGSDYQKRGIALFLSWLQTKKLRERICDDAFWNASNAETKRFCLFILAGVAQNPKEKSGVTDCLNNKPEKKTGALAQAIAHTLSKIQ